MGSREAHLLFEVSRDTKGIRSKENLCHGCHGARPVVLDTKGEGQTCDQTEGGHGHDDTVCNPITREAEADVRLLGIQGQPQLPSKTSEGQGGGRPKIRDAAQLGGLPRIHEA